MLSHLCRAVASSLALAVVGLAVALPAEAATSSSSRKPTVVFVHGGFADSSAWTGVMHRLRKDGFPVRAVGNPLRSLDVDAGYVKDFLSSISGPVILVGHSYGEAVITNAAVGMPNVKALVYIAALAPDTGESLAGLSARPVEHPIPALPLQPVAINGGAETDLYIDPAEFRATFAADRDAVTAADMAATQRPISATSVTSPSGTPAWRTIPSWYLVATQDKALAPDLERLMAKRAGSHTVEVKSSHAVMVSQPAAVARLIENAYLGTR